MYIVGTFCVKQGLGVGRNENIYICIFLEMHKNKMAAQVEEGGRGAGTRQRGDGCAKEALHCEPSYSF